MQSLPGDNELIQKVLQGDQALYAQLVKRYQNLVFTVIMRYTTSREDAEEIAQDVFVKAYRNLADFKGNSKFSTWLYTIVTNTCLTFLRKKKLPVHSLDQEHIFEVADNQNSTFKANQVEQKSKTQLLHDAMRLLSVDDARVLTLFYQAEQSLEEIGRILGIDPNTVKVKLFRARQRLRDRLVEHYREEVDELTG